MILIILLQCKIVKKIENLGNISWNYNVTFHFISFWTQLVALKVTKPQYVFSTSSHFKKLTTLLFFQLEFKCKQKVWWKLIFWKWDQSKNTLWDKLCQLFQLRCMLILYVFLHLRILVAALYVCKILFHTMTLSWISRTVCTYYKLGCTTQSPRLNLD